MKLLPLLLLAAATAHAGTIGIHTISLHDRSDRNTVTPGVYYQWDSGAKIGVVKNSVGNLSEYVSWHGDRKVYQQLSAGLDLGIIHGYSQKALLPLVVPSLSWSAAGVTHRFGLLLRWHDGGSNAVTYAIEF